MFSAGRNCELPPMYTTGRVASDVDGASAARVAAPGADGTSASKPINKLNAIYSIAEDIEQCLS